MLDSALAVSQAKLSYECHKPSWRGKKCTWILFCLLNSSAIPQMRIAWSHGSEPILCSPLAAHHSKWAWQAPSLAIEDCFHVSKDLYECQCKHLQYLQLTKPISQARVLEGAPVACTFLLHIVYCIFRFIIPYHVGQATRLQRRISPQSKDQNTFLTIAAKPLPQSYVLHTDKTANVIYRWHSWKRYEHTRLTIACSSSTWKSLHSNRSLHGNLNMLMFHRSPSASLCKHTASGGVTCPGETWPEACLLDLQADWPFSSRQTSQQASNWSLMTFLVGHYNCFSY